MPEKEKRNYEEERRKNEAKRNEKRKYERKANKPQRQGGDGIMSTIYFLVRKPSITFEQLILELNKRGSLKKHGIKCDKTAEEIEDAFCITDSKNYCWVYKDNGLSYSFTRYGRNNVDGIMEKLEAMGIKTINEYEAE
jgi:hypothetical protein